MKDMVQEWAKRRADDIQKISKGITDASKGVSKTVISHVKDHVKERINPPDPVIPAEKIEKARGSKDVQQPDLTPVQQMLTTQLDREIHRTYYRDGGFRFFADMLQKYASVSMGREDDIEMIWAGAYNTNIQPMVNLVKKLEEKLAELSGEYGCEPLPLQNAQLLDLMREFAGRAETEQLNVASAWQIDDYRRAINAYAADLREKLLDVYQPPLEE